MDEKKKPLSIMTQLFVGGTAGFMADSIAHPLDTIRARIVMKSQVGKYNYTGLFDAIRTIGRTEGLRGFYRGFGAVFAGTIPGHSMYFCVYELSKRHFGKMFNIRRSDHFLLSFGCALLADFAGAIAWVPMEVVKQRAMIYTEHSVLDLARSIFRNHGPLGFYQGFMASIYTFAPYVCFNFAFYEKFKAWQSRFLDTPADELPMVCYLLASTGSSYLSSLLTTPLCVGRTRIQVLQDKKGTNLFRELVNIVREEGLYSLIEVWKARALWFAVGTASTFFIYEGLKRAFRSRNVDGKNERKKEYM